MENKFAVLYIRVSSSDQIDNLSVGVQEEMCRKKAKDEGYEVLDVLKDEGVTGKKRNRPEFDVLRELIMQNKVSAVVAVDSSRLFRNGMAHRELMEIIMEKGIRVLYLRQASPENNASSKLSDRMMADINEFYSDQISDKVKDTLYAKANAGYFPTMPPPGYRNADRPDAEDRYGRKIIEPHPIMAPIITELFQLYSTGLYSVYELTEVMNQRGLRSYRGFPISANRVFDLLKNRIYIGEIKWGKAYIREGKHEWLTDVNTFNRVQAVMESNNHKASRKRKHKWLLSGFVYCANHGKRYVGEWH
jgi:site-specific DNA recombinase